MQQPPPGPLTSAQASLLAGTGAQPTGGPQVAPTQQQPMTAPGGSAGGAGPPAAQAPLREIAVPPTTDFTQPLAMQPPARPPQPAAVVAPALNMLLQQSLSQFSAEQRNALLQLTPAQQQQLLQTLTQQQQPAGQALQRPAPAPQLQPQSTAQQQQAVQAMQQHMLLQQRAQQLLQQKPFPPAPLGSQGGPPVPPLPAQAAPRAVPQPQPQSAAAAAPGQLQAAAASGDRLAMAAAQERKALEFRQQQKKQLEEQMKRLQQQNPMFMQQPQQPQPQPVMQQPAFQQLVRPQQPVPPPVAQPTQPVQQQPARPVVSQAAPLFAHVARQAAQQQPAPEAARAAPPSQAAASQDEPSGARPQRTDRDAHLSKLLMHAQQKQAKAADVTAQGLPQQQLPAQPQYAPEAPQAALRPAPQPAAQPPHSNGAHASTSQFSDAENQPVVQPAAWPAMPKQAGPYAQPPPHAAKPAAAAAKPAAAPRPVGRPGTDPHVWSATERDYLRRLLMLYSVGRWKEIHTALVNTLRTCTKTEEEVRDASYHFIQDLEEFVMVEEDKTFLRQLLEPVADRGKIDTPGASWPRLGGTMVRRLHLLDDIRKQMATLQQPSVYGAWLAALTAHPDTQHVASWWDVQCDVALLYGCWKHGYANYDEIRKDPEYLVLFSPEAAKAAKDAEARGDEEGVARAVAACATAGPNAETLTKRYRKLLDWINKAQKTASQLEEKTRKEAEKAKREAERAVRDEQERERKQEAARLLAEEKLARAMARKKDQEARAEKKAAAQHEQEQEDDPYSALPTLGARGKAKRIWLADNVADFGSDDGKDYIVEKIRKAKAANKDPTQITSKHTAELIRVLMTWGLPTTVDWAAIAKAHPGPPAGSALPSAADDAAGGSGGGKKPANTAPLTDRTAQVVAAVESIQRSLALPPRVTEMLQGSYVSQVWSDVTTLEAALKVFKDQSPVLATRTDACLTEAILDTLADMQDMEDVSTKKKPTQNHIPGNKPLAHAPDCICAVCQRIRKAAARRAAETGGDAAAPQPSVTPATTGAAQASGGGAADGESAPAATAVTGEDAHTEDPHTEDPTNNEHADNEGEGEESEEPDGQPSTGGAKTQGADTATQGAAAAADGDESDADAGDADGDGEDAGEEDDGAAKKGGGGGGKRGGKKGGKEDKANVVLPTLRHLSTQQATRLRERLVLLDSMHAGLELLKPTWQEQQILVNRMGELPVWWAPASDGELVAGVWRHGFGEWEKVFHDSEATFITRQDDFIKRQRARRLAARAMKEGKAAPEGADPIAEDEIDALASTPLEAPVNGAALPVSAALLKRTRQISAVLLRLLRKEKYLKERKKRKSTAADAALGADGEDQDTAAPAKTGPGTRKEKPVDPMLKAKALQIALEAMQVASAAPAAAAAPSADATAGAAAEAPMAAPPAPPAPGGSRGGRGGARAKPAEKPTDPALKAEAWRIALEVMAGGGATKPITAAATAPAAAAAAADADADVDVSMSEHTDSGTEDATAAAEGGGDIDSAADARAATSPEPEPAGPPAKKRRQAAAAVALAVQAAAAPLRASGARGGGAGGRKRGAASGEAPAAKEPAAAPSKKQRGGKKGATAAAGAAAAGGGLSSEALRIAQEVAAAAAGPAHGSAAPEASAATATATGAATRASNAADASVAAAGEVTSPGGRGRGRGGRGAGAGGRAGGRGRGGRGGAAAPATTTTQATGRRGAAAAAARAVPPVSVEASTDPDTAVTADTPTDPAAAADIASMFGARGGDHPMDSGGEEELQRLLSGGDEGLDNALLDDFETE